MASCCNIQPSKTPFGGDLASSVTNKAIRDANRCAVVAAIAKARSNPPCEGCLPAAPGVGGGVAESMLEKRLMNCATLTSTQARQLANSQLRGVPSSVRTQQIQQRTIQNYAPPEDPLRRFVIYGGAYYTHSLPTDSCRAAQFNSSKGQPGQLFGTSSLLSENTPIKK